MWEVINKLNWSSDYNVDRIGVQLHTEFSADERKALYKFVMAKAGKLESILSAQNLGLSSDSLDDLANYIVGCGEATYNEVLKNPSMAASIEAVESFNYIFHTTPEDFDPNTYLTRLTEAARKYRFEPTSETINRTFSLQILQCILDLGSLITHPSLDLEKLEQLRTTSLELVKHPANSELWRIPNIISDFIKFAPFFPITDLNKLPEISSAYRLNLIYISNYQLLVEELEEINEIALHLAKRIKSPTPPHNFNLTNLLVSGFKGFASLPLAKIKQLVEE